MDQAGASELATDDAARKRTDPPVGTMPASVGRVPSRERAAAAKSGFVGQAGVWFQQRATGPQPTGVADAAGKRRRSRCGRGLAGEGACQKFTQTTGGALAGEPAGGGGSDRS